MPDERRNPTVGFEPSDIDARGVTITGLSVLAGTVIIILLLWFPFSWMRHTDVPQPGRTGVAPAFEHLREPLLQQSPRHDLEVMRAEEAKTLDGYRWVDKNAGIASIPIDRAIDFVAGQGSLPAASGATVPLGKPMAGKRATGYEVRILTMPGEP